MANNDGILKSNLKKLWTSYKISRSKKDYENMKETAEKIIKVQDKLGYPHADFEELN